MEGIQKLGNWLAQKFNGPDLGSMSLSQLETQAPRDLAEYIIRLRRELDLKSRALDRMQNEAFEQICSVTEPDHCDMSVQAPEPDDDGDRGAGGITEPPQEPAPVTSDPLPSPMPQA